MQVHMHIYTHLYGCIHACVHMHIHTIICIYTCILEFIRMCTYIFMIIHMYIFIHKLYVYMYNTYIYVCKYMLSKDLHCTGKQVYTCVQVYMHLFIRTYTSLQMCSLQLIFYISETMLLPADMSSFLLSDAAKNCQELALSPPIDIVPSQFYDVRDFILLRIFQTNAQRPMAVRNITENVVRRAKITENTGAVVAVSISTIY